MIGAVRLSQATGQWYGHRVHVPDIVDTLNLPRCSSDPIRPAKGLWRRSRALPLFSQKDYEAP
jgi:hypothetical protein